jgi:hypothetical protein
MDQERLNGFAQRVFGGCPLNRDISALIRQAGFGIERLQHAYLKARQGSLDFFIAASPSTLTRGTRSTPD